MKLVVNKCFGGFGLSMKAEEEYLKRKGKNAFFYTQTKYMHRDGVAEFTLLEDSSATFHITFCFTENQGKSFSEWPDKTTNGCSDKDDLHFYGGDVSRNDPDLIAVVEMLGEKANGQCAKLEIIEIPDGVDWEINEYDGMESVHEKHRSW